MVDTSGNHAEKSKSLVTFTLGTCLFALDINEVDEIKRSFHITRVYRAPEYVSGVVNIRGKIVTVINLKKRLSFENCAIGDQANLVVIRKDREQIGLLVDTIEDAVTAHENAIEPPPANVNEHLRRFVAGICKTEDTLITILDRSTIVERDQNEDHRTMEPAPLR